MLKILNWLYKRQDLSEENLKIAYKNYADSHWTPPEDPHGKTGLLGPTLWSLIPMKHSFESFSEECKKNRRFYKKYSKSIKNI